tara:strand:+ start:268 stop:636 length:369 start_codon:yes stop_codon:yes gene_type:complete
LEFDFLKLYIIKYFITGIRYTQYLSNTLCKNALGIFRYIVLQGGANLLSTLASFNHPVIDIRSLLYEENRLSNKTGVPMTKGAKVLLIMANLFFLIFMPLYYLKYFIKIFREKIRITHLVFL